MIISEAIVPRVTLNDGADKMNLVFEALDIT
jgi:hypothetical protein